MTTPAEARRFQKETVLELEEHEQFLAQVELLDLNMPKALASYLLCTIAALKEEHAMWTDIAAGIRK